MRKPPRKPNLACSSGLFLAAITALFCDAVNAETLAEIGARLGKETSEAYSASPFSALSKNYFSRFTRDPEAQPTESETALTSEWRILIPDAALPASKWMAANLAEFFRDRMNLSLPLGSGVFREVASASTIELSETGGGEEGSPGSFTIEVAKDSVRIAGADPDGLRDGIVRLVDRIGFREAPFLEQGSELRKPRLPLRLGAVPSMGSHRDLVFMGYNALFAGGGSLYSLSTSDCIPELTDRRVAGALDSTRDAVKEATEHGLRPFAFFDTRQKFPKDHPVFKNHPELRGALTWKADGEYVLCTEHPLVKRYLSETVEGIFRAAPGLAGGVVIIGGEGTYHCFMRSFGTQKGHTNCPRCEALGAETVVSNLCNLFAEAARRANPEAVIVAWPYSAEHVWSKDKEQIGFIEKLGPGTGIFTEIEKDEYVEKEDGVRKHLWDYSIDLIGPGERAKKQIEACRARGIPIFLKSEPELGFEAPRLPQIPCMDRWADRAAALDSCGADGAWVFPAFRPNYGTSAAEVNKFFWWDPAPDKEQVLGALAARLAGKSAAPHLREAWRLVSEAIPLSPEIPPYYTGPYYLGPAHPMCADPKATVPEVFFGRYLFMAEMTDSEGVKLRPTFLTSPRGDVPVFARMYRGMADLLSRAAREIEAASPLVEERHRLTFESERLPILWFAATARTQANFHESCQIRDRLVSLADQASRDETEVAEAKDLVTRWEAVLSDELANARGALGIAEADMRLDCYYGGDHTFSHMTDMVQAKIEILEREIGEFLPSLERRLGI